MRKELTVVSENKAGVLADVCHMLGHAGVNLEAISAQGEGNNGVIRLITSDPTTAEKLLKRGGYNVMAHDVIVIKINDSPGELGKVTKALSKEGINLEAIYLLDKAKGVAHLALKPAGDIEQVRRLIKGSLAME